MEPVAPQLPAALGSTAALVVASVSLLVQTSPLTCLLRAVAAFVVFAAFGIVIRALLADAMGRSDSDRSSNDSAKDDLSMDDIIPGTSIDDLLAEDA
jgi:hypothetical protein